MQNELTGKQIIKVQSFIFSR